MRANSPLYPRKIVTETVLESMRRILLNVQACEKEFACKQMDCYSEDKKKELAKKCREPNKARKGQADNGNQGIDCRVGTRIY